MVEFKEMILLRALLFCIFIYPSYANAGEELVLVQTVAADGKTFVIRKGSMDDIRVGKEALFSSKHASVKARAIKTTRFFSVWELLAKDAKFPFRKKVFITFNADLDTIWYSVPTVKTKYNYRAWKPSTYFKFRAGYSYTISESVTDISADNKPTRTNLQMDIMWHKEVRERKIDWGWGIRYDSESATTTNPIVVNIPSQRIMLITEFTFHFPRHKKTKNNFYGTFGLGAGQSSTTIDDESSTGYALLFPQITLGFSKQIGDKKAMIFEATGEVINSEEKFSDGTLQTSNFINIKAGIGFKF